MPATHGIRPRKVKIGYEISFNRYFFKPQPMRSLEEIRADILALEKESDGLLDEILGCRPINQAAPGSGADTLATGSCGTDGRKTMRPMEIIFEVTEAVEGGYDARALGYDIFTHGGRLGRPESHGSRCGALLLRGSQCTQGDSAPPRQGRGHRGVKLPRNLSGERLVGL